jgi:serine/threonine protein kinase
VTDPLSTQRLGRYRILRKLGKGGMSTVYHAVQEGPHGFENEVAVKLIDPELLAEFPHLRKALVDEARIAARIRHPNVVRILDLVDEGDQLYMVMDFVDGVSMRQVLDAARQSGINPPVGPLLEVLAAAADGLHAAHQLVGTDGASLELVHRDVKPGNILVGADGQVKVSDFGIAMFDDRAAEATAHGQMKGTPAYMAPEQVMGEAVDWRADIFSLGLTLYTMATSRLVFYGDTALAIAMKIATHPLDDHAEALDALAPGLGDVFERMTTRDPAGRYRTAQEAGNALRVVHAHLESSHSVAELLASAGWRRWVRSEPPPPPVEPQPTPALATAPDDEEQPTAIDEPVAIAREPDLLRPAEDEPTVDGPAEDEPTDAGPGPAVGLDTDRGEQSTAEGPAPIPSSTFDAEATPPAPPPPLASAFAPPPGAPPPPPGGMILDARAEVVESRPTPPPAAQSTAAMDRSQYQPVRDYRGRVVRKKTVDPDAARVTGTERLGVAVAFLLMVAAVAAIIWVQLKNPPPVDKDPRVVADAAAIVGEDEAKPATTAPEPTPDAVAAAAGRSILDRTKAGDEPAPREAKAAAKPKSEPKAAAKPAADAKPKPTPAPTVTAASPKLKAAPKATPKPKVAAAEPEAEPPAEADPGSLTVNTYPWSNVTVDGVARGRTPVRSLAMPPGKHTVKLVFPTLDDKVVTKTVTVTSGEDTRLMERLDAKADDAP